jgi:hypothetical protein
VVGGVQHFLDPGELFPDQPLDPLLQRNVRGPAALAAAANQQVDHLILDSCGVVSHVE